MLDWQHGTTAPTASQPCSVKTPACRSGGVLRQLPGHPWLQRLPVVQLHRRQVNSPPCSSATPVTAAGFHWCSEPTPLLLLPWYCPSSCYYNQPAGGYNYNVDWKGIDWLPGYCWLLGDPNPRQRFTRLVVGKTRLCSRTRTCWPLASCKARTSLPAYLCCCNLWLPMIFESLVTGTCSAGLQTGGLAHPGPPVLCSASD